MFVKHLFLFQSLGGNTNKIMRRTSHCHTSGMTGTGNRGLTHFWSATGKCCGMWPLESEEVGFSEVAGLVEEHEYGLRATYQRTRSTFWHFWEQDKGKHAREFCSICILNCFLDSLMNEVLLYKKRELPYWGGRGGHVCSMPSTDCPIGDIAYRIRVTWRQKFYRFTGHLQQIF